MEDVTEDEPRRGPGRPPKVKDTPDTVHAWVRMKKRVTMPDGSKTPKGEQRCETLREARKMVARDLAEWMDPRPDVHD